MEQKPSLLEDRIMTSCNQTEFAIAKYQPAPDTAKKTLSPESILLIVSTILDIPVSEIKSRSRKREVVTARYICFYLIKRDTDLSLCQIAKVLDRKNDDHSIVLYGLQVHQEQVSYKSKYLQTFKKVMELYGSMENTTDFNFELN